MHWAMAYTVLCILGEQFIQSLGTSAAELQKGTGTVEPSSVVASGMARESPSFPGDAGPFPTALPWRR